MNEDTPRVDDSLGVTGETLAQQAYANLRAAIVAGVFRPGDALREPELTTRLKVSRSPLREALRRLDSDGLVEVLPRQGARVRRLGFDDARELTEIRLMLEGQAAELAAKRAAPDALAQLWSVVDDSTKEGGPTPRSLLINQGFHEGIARQSGNLRLARMITNIIDQISLWRMGALDKGAAFRGTVDEHRKILKAIEDGDAKLARDLMQAHIEASWKTSRVFAQENEGKT